MFAVHTPQTVTLAVPGEDGPFTTINFKTNGADTSRCVMEIIDPDGNVQRLTFVTRGGMVDQQYIDGEHAEQDVQLTPEDYMVGGRDTRADNPYTHVAPVDADTAYRDGQTPGYRTPEPRSDAEKEALEAGKELEDKLYGEAREHKRDLRDAALDRRRQRDEQLGIPTRPEEGTAEGDAWSADKSTAQPVATDRTFPEKTGEQADAYGRDSTGEVVGNPDGERMAPPPSSPLAGSPPPHPESRPDHGKVNTTQSMQGRREPVGLRPAPVPETT